MTKYIKCGGGGLPPQVLSDMEAVLNKKFGTSTTYPSNTWPDLIRTMIPLPEKTASGSIAHFEDGADTVPLKSSKFYITPTQASGTPTPSNPLPISGHTGLTITRTGANLWDEEWEVGTINNQGQNATDNTRIRAKNYISVKPNTSIYFFHSGGISSLYYYDINKDFISSGSFDNSKAYTIPSNCYYLRFIMASAYGNTYNNDISINYPSTDTSYHAYNGNTYPVSWSEHGTVYGGYFKDGELWKTHEIVDLGSLSWIYTNNVFRGVISDGVILNSTQQNIIDYYCSCYLVKGSGNSSKWSSDNLVAWHGTGSSCYIYVNDTNYNDADVFKTAVTGQKLVYELATPVKVADLEEVEITSLLGVNNIWCDTGDCEVEYRADIELSLNE